MPRRGRVWLAMLAGIGLLAAACTREPPAAKASEPDAPGPLLPALASRQRQVDHIEVIGAGAKPLLKFWRVGDDWWMDGRPWHADNARVAQYLLTLAQARRVEAKTDRGVMYPRIGVEDVSDPNATGVELHLSGKGGFDARLIIGKPHKPSRGRYVRLAGNARSWLVDSDVGFDADPMAWLDHHVLSIPVQMVERVRVRPRNAPEYALVMREDRFGPDDAPPGAMRNSHAGDDIAAAMDDFQADDVQSGGSDEPTSQQLIYELFDGGVLSVRVWREGPRDWARFDTWIDGKKAYAWSQTSGHAGWVEACRARAQKWILELTGRKFLLSPELARTLTLDHSQLLEGTPAPGEGTSAR